MSQLALTNTCPRCDKSGWRNRRALAGHLHHCRGSNKLLLDKFKEGDLLMKHAVNAATNDRTVVQRIRDAEQELSSGHRSGYSRLYNQLSTLPSIDALAKSVDDLDCPDVMFDSSDIEYGESPGCDESGADLEGPNLMHQQGSQPSSPQVVLGSPDTFDKLQFEAEMNDVMLFQIHMEHAIHNHREVDQSVMDDVVKIIQLHSKRGVDISKAHLVPRDALIKMVAKSFNLHHLKPRICKVPISNGTASVGVFDLKSKLCSILHNPEIMKAENIAEGYDIFTGRAEESDWYGEIHTGWLWEMAREHYCGDDPDAMPLGLVCFYDKTWTDIHGANSTSPFIAVPTFLNSDERMKAEVRRSVDLDDY